MILHARKKPTVIQCLQYTGDNASEAKAFVGASSVHNEDTQELFIETLEGLMHVSLMDFIIRGVQGEFYPCKPDIFAATYEVLT